MDIISYIILRIINTENLFFIENNYIFASNKQKIYT
jgi:hypothetical protein